MSVNSAVISGHIGKMPELRFTKSGTAVLSFSVAVNERIKDDEGEWTDRPSWVKVTVFGRRAEGLSKILTSGSKVVVSGRLREDRWENNGVKKSSLGMIADEIDLAGGKTLTDADYGYSEGF